MRCRASEVCRLRPMAEVYRPVCLLSSPDPVFRHFLTTLVALSGRMPRSGYDQRRRDRGPALPVGPARRAKSAKHGRDWGGKDDHASSAQAFEQPGGLTMTEPQRDTTS